ncbi:ATP-binding protein [Pelagicoccus sp. SDUM812003]|uniref:ATP-binding protein n=1 Tax=Pelagicoccus sp. SDUM812003 TaxID=3041267 RepID=UPI00280CE3C7|nr:ATP-binding protein [Pelagicoccus sp. SDUM812003]MDQ8203844.1 ATP-binding protein [Pelagicoccus sp. SDUM812003]
MLRAAIEELVENASQYSPAGTRIRISGEQTEDDYLLTIADRGRGMSAEQIDAFIPFERQPVRVGSFSPCPARRETPFAIPKRLWASLVQRHAQLLE